VDTLVEALYSYIIQDYPSNKKELIIVNDCPFQDLDMDRDVMKEYNIKIFNLGDTFPTIGEKENFAIAQCKGQLIAVWDDDDVALSNHLQNIAKFWTPEANILHWANGVYYNEPNITALTGLGNSGIVYSRDAWIRIGRSPIMNAGGDMVLVNSLHWLPGETIYANPEDENVSWFYMWGGRGYHQSGQGTDLPGKPNIIERHTAFIASQRLKGLVPEGKIILEPKWNHDYKQMLIKFIKDAP
jgi:hypothetical protein